MDKWVIVFGAAGPDPQSGLRVLEIEVPKGTTVLKSSIEGYISIGQHWFNTREIKAFYKNEPVVDGTA